MLVLAVQLSSYYKSKCLAARKNYWVFGKIYFLTGLEMNVKFSYIWHLQNG